MCSSTLTLANIKNNNKKRNKGGIRLVVVVVAATVMKKCEVFTSKSDVIGRKIWTVDAAAGVLITSTSEEVAEKLDKEEAQSVKLDREKEANDEDHLQKRKREKERTHLWQICFLSVITSSAPLRISFRSVVGGLLTLVLLVCVCVCALKKPGTMSKLAVRFPLSAGEHWTHWTVNGEDD